MDRLSHSAWQSFPFATWYPRLRHAWRGLTLIGLVWLLAWQGGTPMLDAQESIAMHVVRYGETLSEIAQSYQVSVDELMGRNDIDDADSIYVGQTLVVPFVGEEEAGEEEVARRIAASDGIADARGTDGDRSAANPDVAESGAGAAEPSIIRAVDPVSLNPSHTVQPGETLGWIALRYGVELDALRAINGLEPGAAIRLGEQLLLPATEDELRPQRDPLLYTVQTGDSLSLIAQDHDVATGVLMAINRIANADLIQPGRVLEIPRASGEQSAPRAGPAQAGFYYHNVSLGETLSQLAEEYDSTPQAIVRYNDLPNTETVFSGLEVRIPYGPPVVDRRQPPVRSSGTEFVISISRQRCWLVRGDRILHQWKCSTGQGEWVTRTGTFPVQSKIETAQSSAYRLDMPYWLGLYDVGNFENGIHGLPVDWESGEKLWDTLIGQPATFGCAMLTDENAETLFHLAYIGMPVHIVD